MISQTQSRKRPTLPAFDVRAVGGILLILAFFVWNAIDQLRAEWSLNPQYSYGWVVPILTLFLIVRRWSSLPVPSPPTGTKAVIVIFGLLLVTLLPLRIFQEANPDWRPVSWAVAGHSVTGILLIVYWVAGGRWVKHLCFPVFFFLVSVPWVGPLERAIVQSLMTVNTSVNAELLNLLGIPAVQRGSIIDLMAGSVGVNEACSGIRSVQSSVMISLFLGEYHRLRIGERALLLVAALGIVLVANVCRTATLCLIANTSGLQALDRWHDPLGFAVSIVTIAALFIVAHLIARGSTYQSELLGTDREDRSKLRLPVWPIPAVAVVWIGIVLFTSHSWFRLREADVRPSTRWTVAWPRSLDSFKELPIDDLSKVELRYNEGQHAEWFSGTLKWEAFLFRWHAGRNAAQLASSHNPAVCLPSAGLNLVVDFGVRNIQSGELVLPFRAFQFDAAGRPVLVFYCLWEDVVRPAKHAVLREDKSPASRLAAALEGKRHLGQQVMQAAVWGTANLEEAERGLAKLVQLVEQPKP